MSKVRTRLPPDERRKLILEVGIREHLALRVRPVLADQHERRQEDRFDRGGRSQNDKCRIECGDEGNPADVDGDPDPDNHQVDIDERHAAGERRDGIRRACLHTLRALLLASFLSKHRDVAMED